MTGDTNTLEALNSALEIEQTAAELYAAQAACFRAWGLPKLAEKWAAEILEELTHRQKLYDRIAVLDGTPTDKHYPADRPGDKALAIEIEGILETGLALEEEGRKRYRDGIPAARKAGDETSALLMAEILEQTEDHIVMLEGLISTFQAVGTANWLASWL